MLFSFSIILLVFHLTNTSDFGDAAVTLSDMILAIMKWIVWWSHFTESLSSIFGSILFDRLSYDNDFWLSFSIHRLESIQSFLKYGWVYLLIEGLWKHVTHTHSLFVVLLQECLQTRILINSILLDFHKKSLVYLQL